jgi:hypothetical protein
VRNDGTVNVAGGASTGCIGFTNADDFGAGHRLKLVVLPLNALMFRENFASGEAAAAASQDTQKADEGFKDIL